MKLSVNNWDKPAPIKYQRFVKMMIRFVMPAAAVAVIAMPVGVLSSDAKNVIGIVGTFITAVLSGLEWFLSDGDAQ